MGHLWKRPYFSGFWNNSLGLLAPIKLSGTHKCWKTIKSFVPLQQFWKCFVLYYQYLPDLTDSFFIQILLLSILGIPSTSVIPGVFYCHHSAHRLPFWIVYPTTASCHYYSIFLFQINTEIFSCFNDFRNWAEIRWGNWSSARFHWLETYPSAVCLYGAFPLCLAGNKCMMLQVLFHPIAVVP